MHRMRLVQDEGRVCRDKGSLEQAFRLNGPCAVKSIVNKSFSSLTVHLRSIGGNICSPNLRGSSLSVKFIGLEMLHHKHQTCQGQRQSTTRIHHHQVRIPTITPNQNLLKHRRCVHVHAEGRIRLLWIVWGFLFCCHFLGSLRHRTISSKSSVEGGGVKKVVVKLRFRWMQGLGVCMGRQGRGCFLGRTLRY